MSNKSPEQIYMDELYSAASEYLDRGWSIFPLSIDGKRPLAEWKEYQTQRVTHDTLEEWFTEGAPTTKGGRQKLFNIALVTGSLSGILVVDCDNQAAQDYARSNSMTSPITVTTTRGSHYYFRHPGQGQRFANKAGGVAHNWPDLPGLDFRGDGGYVVAPPSLSFNDDGTIKHIYEYELAPGAEWDDMPKWAGQTSSVEKFDVGELHSGPMSFEDINLTGVRVGGEKPQDIEGQLSDKVALLGRKLTDGDGTDTLMIRLCGQLVRRGLTNGALLSYVERVYDECFEDSYTKEQTDSWLKSKIRSAIQMDRSNYREDYEDDGSRKQPKAEEAGEADELEMFNFAQAKRLILNLKDQAYWSDPILPVGGIVQVVGFNGHGKSIFLSSMLTSLAAGHDSFGHLHHHGTPTILYFDYDNGANILLSRFISQGTTWGDPEDRMLFISPSVLTKVRDAETNLLTDGGQKNFHRMLRRVKPDIVVIDTVRNAYAGMEENGTQHWAIVNKFAKEIRNLNETTVVLVHHRNKPGDQGLGREAGSTAQLTDIDTQVIITQVYDDEEKCKRNAGLLDANLKCWDHTYLNNKPDFVCLTPFSYMKGAVEAFNKLNGRPLRIRTVLQIAYGKVRNETGMHSTNYIGFLEYLDDEESVVVSPPSRRQSASFFASNGIPINKIAQLCYTPMSTLREWLK